eukprot:TRINITY_DN3388_c0_g1_i4.p1 TRINITY_DN3388_c0_g1~~TRINITY_DN3388_c0_g1_i4.p1  ORF type:complete len:642 (+),score=110.25 TRINITY_DN3388_c0_g1_i4:89-2014(+)
MGNQKTLTKLEKMNTAIRLNSKQYNTSIGAADFIPTTPPSLRSVISETTTTRRFRMNPLNLNTRLANGMPIRNQSMVLSPSPWKNTMGSPIETQPQQRPVSRGSLRGQSPMQSPQLAGIPSNLNQMVQDVQQNLKTFLQRDQSQVFRFRPPPLTERFSNGIQETLQTPEKPHRRPVVAPTVHFNHEDGVMKILNAAPFVEIGSEEWRTATIPDKEATQRSMKGGPVVRGFAANTHKGLVRNYNEDRVAIVLNPARPLERNRGSAWPRCAFFGVFDGHGGSACADYLRDNLHKVVLAQDSYPNDVHTALATSFRQIEEKFLEIAVNTRTDGKPEKAGSCAIVVMVVDDWCHVANVGDSRAVMSMEGGTKVAQLSRDHRPLEDSEFTRIIDAGGFVHQMPTPAGSGGLDGSFVMAGPYRVFPGRLSVSRTFGDVEAKRPEFGGKPNVVIATPDVEDFKLGSEHDFIVLACDGIFDVLSSEEVIRTVWETARDHVAKNIHDLCAAAVENILRFAFARKANDNLTVSIIALDGLERRAFPPQPEAVPVRSLSLQKAQSVPANNVQTPIVASLNSSWSNTPVSRAPMQQSSVQAQTGRVYGCTPTSRIMQPAATFSSGFNFQQTLNLNRSTSFTQRRFFPGGSSLF